MVIHEHQKATWGLLWFPKNKRGNGKHLAVFKDESTGFSASSTSKSIIQNSCRGSRAANTLATQLTQPARFSQPRLVLWNARSSSGSRNWRQVTSCFQNGHSFMPETRPATNSPARRCFGSPLSQVTYEVITGSKLATNWSPKVLKSACWFSNHIIQTRCDGELGKFNRE